MNLSEISKVLLSQEKAGDDWKASVDDDDEDANTNSSGAPDESTTNNDSTTGAKSERTNGTDDDMQTIKDALTKKETSQVLKLRVIVIMILIAASASISGAVYYITRSGQVEEFEVEFASVADKIIDVMQEIVVEISAVAGLAVIATADAQERGDEWPFVTISAFQEKANNARDLSGAIYLSLNPIVQPDQFLEWEKYVLSDVNSWITKGMATQEQLGINRFVDQDHVEESWITTSVVDPLHTFDDFGRPLFSASDGPYLPRWQTSPVLQTSMVNENLLEKDTVSSILKDALQTESAVLGGFHSAPPGDTSHPDPTTAFFATLRCMWDDEQVEYLGDPMSHIVIPIFDRLEGPLREVVGFLKATIHWHWYLRNVLPETDYGITVVIENECDGSFTYQLDGATASVIGFGDLHDRKFSKYGVTGRFQNEIIGDGSSNGIRLNQHSCPYFFHVYPAQEDYDHYITNEPIIISLSIAAVFIFTIGMFLFYDRLVERRQRMVLAKATQSTAIVSSLFPKQVRDRLLQLDTDKKDKRRGDSMMAGTHKLKSYLDGGNTNMVGNDEPIADFFPNCTVFFADIAGFTAWSSTREPAQVFILLQTLYQAFDKIAKRRRVFKVETIGDSYLAVTGLPDPQVSHATIMAKFAWETLIKMGEVTKELEVSLGPDTGELSMRLGLNSGSVTAGVLKGDRARFQLFGDTVNTAARMESTGMKGRIQISESTAALLKQAGKSSWLTPRADMVSAKGKGIMSTYWLALKNTGPSVATGGSSEDAASRAGISTKDLTPMSTSLRKSPKKSMDERAAVLKEARLVDWVTEMLLDKIKKVVIVHQRCHIQEDKANNMYFQLPDGQICLDEVKEVITMPTFDLTVAEAALDSHDVEAPQEIASMLREYVTLIARSYRGNPFHNFEHACHVTMSVNKLLTRIVTPDLASAASTKDKKALHEMAAEIHNFTHGLTSDPMASFAIVFSALIHDVDHQGVSNVQLAKEEPAMGELYRNKSVAEQNSLDIAWDLLMSEQFDQLRKFIFGTQEEMLRFRQLIVNVVLATDIFDKELGQLRKDRWNRAFHGDADLTDETIRNMRATIVIEHIIQASDVSHTMQHWHVYQKWNRKLFEEMYQAWKSGRMGSNPSEFWYQGELGFFDNYIIPLAKKLKECNVFGVSSDEYLGYALRNRAEWEERGQDILKTMVEEIDSSLRTEQGTIDPTIRTVSESIGDTVMCSDDSRSSSAKSSSGDAIV